MSTRARLVAFGLAAVLVAAGALCAAFVGGLTGQVLGIALVTVGLGGAVLLTFFEVGLSEDREREKERRRERAAQRPVGGVRPRPRRRGR